MKKVILKSVMWMGGANLFTQLVTWGFTFAIARMLTPEDYGLIGMAGVYIGMTECINELGIGTAIVQRRDLNEDDVKGIYSVAIAFGVVSMVVSYWVSPLISWFFNEPRLLPLLQFLSLTYLISSAKSVQRNLMLRDMKFSSIAKVEVASGILTSVAGLACALAGLGVWTLAIQYLSMNLCNFLGAFCYERRLPGRIADWTRLRDMLRFGVGITSSKVLFSINRNVDSLIIGKLLGKTYLGSYTLALTLANKPFEKILPILNQVFLPLFSRTQDDIGKLRQYLLRILEIELMIFTPVFTLLALTADDIVLTALGGKWAGAIMPMRVFSMLGFCKYLESRVSIVLTAMGHARPQVRYSLSLALVMAVSVAVLAHLKGITGVMLAWSICYPAVFFIYFRYFLRVIGISLGQVAGMAQRSALSNVIMCSCVLSTAAFGLDTPLLRLAVKLLIAVVAYLGSCYVLDRKMFREIKDLVVGKRTAIPA